MLQKRKLIILQVKNCDRKVLDGKTIPDGIVLWCLNWISSFSIKQYQDLHPLGSSFKLSRLKRSPERGTELLPSEEWHKSTPEKRQDNAVHRVREKKLLCSI